MSVGGGANGEPEGDNILGETTPAVNPEQRDFQTPELLRAIATVGTQKHSHENGSKLARHISGGRLGLSMPKRLLIEWIV